MRIHACILLLAATQLGATDCGAIIEDPGFDHWCGERLCFWETERGEIRRVPTWHRGDDGVEFVGDDVAISQMTPVNSWDTDCIGFEFVADVEASAEVFLEADVFGDGTVEWRERVPTSRWDQVSFRIGLEGSYEGIKFRLTKAGAGRAVLAQIAAQVEDDCPSSVDLLARPLGAACLQDADCASEVCNGWVCSTCDLEDVCAAGQVCGREADAPGHLADWWTCVAPGSRGLGEKCFDDAECATGACDDAGICAECSGLVACAGGATCTTDGSIGAAVCADEPRPAGAACMLDDQCASGACDGAAWGRCDTDADDVCYEDDDCPARSDLTPGACTFVAVARGTCQ